MPDWNKFTGWVTWALIAIHPKPDGNGRLGKAMAQYMCPNKEIMEWKDELWSSAFRAANEEIKQQVSQQTGQPVPNFSRFTDSAQDKERKRDLMRGFYRCNGHNHVANFITNAIKNTRIKEGAFKPGGLSERAASLFELFIEKAPDYPC